MSYDEFPDEYAILKRSLEQEDYDRAESVLLMVLKRKPDFQQAQLDLERVRGKLGSISNYEFRVKAFLDQGDLTQAGRILDEAKQKFAANRKIRALIEHYDRLSGKRGSDGAAAASEPRGPASALAGEDDEEELPNLQTFVVDNVQIPGIGGSSPRGAKAGSGGMPGFGGKATRRASKAAAVAEAGGSAATDAPKASEAATQSAASRPTGGARAAATTTAGTQTRAVARDGMSHVVSGAALSVGDHLSRRLDTVIVLLAWVLVLLPLGGVIAMLGVAQAERFQAVAVGTLREDIKARLDRWGSAPPANDAERRDLRTYYHEFFGNPEQTPDVRVVSESHSRDLPHVEAIYRAFLRIAQHSPDLIDLERVNAWRAAAYQHANRIPPLDAAWLAGTEWNPRAVPPQFGLEGVWMNTARLLLVGLLAALLPGLLLGVALAYCRVPLLNRVFDVVWEAWYALPAVALLYLGLVGLVELFGMQPSALFASVLLGVAMVPHVAFYVRQGLENVQPLEGRKQVPLGVLALISAALATGARFVGEGILVIAVGTAAGVVTVQSAGLTIVEALRELGAHNVAPATFAQHAQYSMALLLGFWGMIVAVGLSLLAQILQVIVAAVGLKYSQPSTHESPEASAQSAFAPASVVATGLGLVVAVGVAVVLLAAHAAATNTAPAGSGWTAALPASGVEMAARHTLIGGLIAGGAATLLGLLIALVHTVSISTRRARAWLEAAFRVPTALPPLLIALAGFVALGAAKPSPITAIAVLALALTPLAAVVLMRSFEQTRRGPYVPDSQGRAPRAGMIASSRVFEFVGVAGFVSAVAAGSFALVLGLGPAESGTMATLPAGLFAALADTPASDASFTYYSRLLLVVGMCLGGGFAARLVAELFARVALARRM